MPPDSTLARYATRIAVREAAKARHRQFRHGALVLRGRRILSLGHNHEHQHAEHSALNRAWRSGTEGTTLFVIRITKLGVVTMSRPCKGCMTRAKAAGVTHVAYSDWNGSIAMERL